MFHVLSVLGRAPWSSGYGRRLRFQRLWVRIPSPYTGWTWHFSHLFVVKIVLGVPMSPWIDYYVWVWKVFWRYEWIRDHCLYTRTYFYYLLPPHLMGQHRVFFCIIQIIKLWHLLTYSQFHINKKNIFVTVMECAYRKNKSENTYTYFVGVQM